MLSLAALLLADSGKEINADSLATVAVASGNAVPAYMPDLFAGMIAKAGGVEKFMAGPSAGGAGESFILYFSQKKKCNFDSRSLFIYSSPSTS